MAALSFNAASWQSVAAGGAAFTATDPVLGSAFLLALGAGAGLTARRPGLHGAFCALGACALGAFGSWAHVKLRDTYFAADAYHNTHWRYAVALNTCGAGILASRAYRGPSRRGATVALALVALVALALTARGSDGGCACRRLKTSG